MCKLIWLPLIAFYLNTNQVNKKPEGYPFVPAGMAELAVSKGYPMVDAVLGKFQAEFREGKNSSYVILSYQELIDWFRDEKHIHINIIMDTFTKIGLRKGGHYTYEIRNTFTTQCVQSRWLIYDNYYEAQHDAIMDAFKIIEDVKLENNTAP